MREKGYSFFRITNPDTQRRRIANSPERSSEHKHLKCEKRVIYFFGLQILILKAGELQIRLNGEASNNLLS